MKHYMIVDLDGTVCDVAHRIEHALAAKKLARSSNVSAVAVDKAWDKFHRGLRNDLPHEDVCKVVRSWAAAGNNIIYLTARPERHRAATLLWFAEFQLPVGALVMRADADFRNAVEVKGEWLTIIKRDYLSVDDRIALFLEDDPRLVALWRSLGYTCLQHGT